MGSHTVEEPRTLYLNYLARRSRPSARVVGPRPGMVPPLSDLWRLHWERSGVVDIDVADTMPEGWERWLEWHRTITPNNREEIQTLKTDRGRYLGYVRVVGRRRPNSLLQDPVISVPVTYAKAPLLRRPT